MHLKCYLFQLNAFRALMSNKVGEAPKALVDNYRPPQPLNYRVVTTNIEGVRETGGQGGGSTQTGNSFCIPNTRTLSCHNSIIQ